MLAYSVKAKLIFDKKAKELLVWRQQARVW